jgi:hypothetical protein
MEQKEKIFMNGIFIREKQFDNGGSLLNIDIVNVYDFAEQLKKHAKSDGKIRLEFKQRMNKGENGLTHYCEVSTFEPKPQQPQQTQSSQNFSTNENNFDDVPF